MINHDVGTLFDVFFREYCTKTEQTSPLQCIALSMSAGDLLGPSVLRAYSKVDRDLC